MAIDDERREVAKALREANFYMSYRSKREMWDELRKIIGEYNDRPFGGVHTFARLADLIDPGEPKVRCVAEVKVDGERLEKLVHDAVVELTGIDRDALLVLADEMDEVAQHRRSMGYEGFAIGDKYRARLIRKALGVDE